MHVAAANYSRVLVLSELEVEYLLLGVVWRMIYLSVPGSFHSLFCAKLNVFIPLQKCFVKFNNNFENSATCSHTVLSCGGRIGSCSPIVDQQNITP